MEPTSLSIVQLAAIVAGYALAFSRLTDAARPLWQWVKPPWLQTLLPALVTVLPDFASALGLVKTKTDFVQAIVVAVGALGFAMRGALPKKVYDRLPLEAKADLKAARKPIKDDDKTPPDGSKRPRVHFMPPMVMVFLVTGCGLFGSKQPDECSFDNAAYSARVLECDAKIGACPKREDGTPQEDCRALAECERWLAEVCK